MASSRQCSSFNAVQREIENVEIAQPAGLGDVPVFGGQWLRQDKGHELLAETAMRAQAMAGEPRKVVLDFGGADRGIGVAEDNEIALPVERQFEPLRGAYRVEHQSHSRQFRARRHQSGSVRGASRVDADKRSEGAGMAHERIGNRTDHPYRFRPQTTIELVFKDTPYGVP